MRDVNSFFAKNPTSIDVPRSIFERNQDVKFTANAGDLIPFYVDEVLPGDTFNMSSSYVVRMSTPIHPVMDDSFMDVYYFFVPHRLVWDHWEEFNGENDKAWRQSIDYIIPQITTPRTDSGYSSESGFFGYGFGSVADYMGIPPYTAFESISALPFRSYVKIWNDWFRDENLQNSAYFPTDDSTRAGDSGYAPNSDIDMDNPASYFERSDPWTTAHLGGSCLPVSKYFDFFTGALPEPQKGPNVGLPVTGTAEVFGEDLSNSITGTGYGAAPMILQGTGTTNVGVDGTVLSGDTVYTQNIINTNQNQVDYSGIGYIFDAQDPVSDPKAKTYASSLSNDVPLSPYVGYGVGLATKSMLDKMGASSPVYADISGALGTINELRLAFAIQKLYERDARGGSRYIEIIKSHFGVTSPDARLQRSEFLAGDRIRINMNQVLQTSSTDSTSPQGNTAAYSLSSGRDAASFTKSFTEHGYVIGVCCFRTHHTYQQGIEKLWSRKSRFDYYWPALANIGEQPIYNREIYTGSPLTMLDPTETSVYSSAVSLQSEVFGFQEAWAEYRYKPSRLSSGFRSVLDTIPTISLGIPNSLDVWHYGDYYDSQPHLSDEWIRETPVNIDRTLAVTSSLSHQFICDFLVKNKSSRPMPLYSVPGLIDHN